MNLPFDRYLAENSGPLSGERLKDFDRTPRYRFVSQIWQGKPWEHELLWVVPDEVINGELAILYITGGDINALDLAEARIMADQAQVPVALLHHIPNQPIEDLWEDDLIAYTFNLFLETGDTSLPLVFPMAAATLSAINLVQDFTEGHVSKFIVTGISKRGWATWMAAASQDPRIVGIVPCSIDTLNMVKQMEHQRNTWGNYSEQISSYTNLELQDAPIHADRGPELAMMVDPFYYRDRLGLPKIIATGTNDRYWQVDATNLYKDALPGRTLCCAYPNAGHNLGNRAPVHSVLTALADHCSGGISLPTPEWNWQEDQVEVGGEADSYNLWVANSDTYDFREAEWKMHQTSTQPLPFGLPTGGLYRAFCVEFAYHRKRYSVSFTSPVQVYHGVTAIRLRP